MESLDPEVYDKEKVLCLNDLFDWLVAPCLKQIQESHLFLPYSELHLVKCQLNLLSSLLGIKSLDAPRELSRQQSQAVSYRTFFFAASTRALADMHHRRNCKDLNCVLCKQAGTDAPLPVEVDPVQMQMAFLFSILWGLCSTITDLSRPKFDAFFRYSTFI